MGEKMNGEYNFESGATAFNYNNVTGGGDSASGGSGGSGMECMQLRSSPGPFHYLISEQAKSLVALQELQNEVGALLEFRDLVIETFPNLRSKMAPSMPAATRRDWEPGVRVRRKLAAAGDARTKPQPSVQDSGFSTETSCGKDAHSSSASASASASRSRPLEDELWALLDVIQRKGCRLRDEAELLRAELDERPPPDTAEESFARALQSTPECEGCAERVRLRAERDALLARSAALEAAAALAASPRAPLTPRTPLGRLDRLLSPSCPRVATPDSRKFTAILLESNPVELQRQLLTATVQNQVYEDKLQRVAAQRTVLVQRLEQARDHNDDLRFRLEEKNIELEGARARLRQLEGHKKGDSLERSRSHSSMRDMEPLALPDEDREPTLGDTPRRRPSRIPLHTAHKGSIGTIPRPPRSPAPCSQPARPPSAHSARSAASPRGRAPPPPRKPDCKPPAPRRPQPPDNKKPRPAEGSAGQRRLSGGERGHSLPRADLVAEYVARTERLAPLFPRLHTVRTRPTPVDLILDSRLAYQTPQNLALELCKSILYENADSIDIKNLKSLNSHGEDSLWNGKPQQYFESMNYAEQTEVGGEVGREAYSEDSLAP